MTKAGIIDTHAHLDDNKFRKDLQAVRARALEAGVTTSNLPLPTYHFA
jgi:Tat protein secretion system quality control protein TatD with DNase activity